MSKGISGERKFDDDSDSLSCLQWRGHQTTMAMSCPIPRSKSRPVFSAVVFLRAAGIIAILTFFFVVAAPIQWLLLRLKSPLSRDLPRLFYRALLWLVKVRVAAHSARPEEIPQLIVANHISWTDIPALGTIYPVSFVAKREVATWPIIATFARLEGTVFVDRNNRKSILDANAAMAERLSAGACVVLFPEGTTYDGTSLGLFHSSHFAGMRDLLALNVAEPHVRVQPVAIRYSSQHAAWIGDDSLLPHILGLIRGPPVTCELLFCESFAFGATADRKAIAQECRARIAAALGAPSRRLEKEEGDEQR
jgi:lyso-ornithine lipid O-acyltransferase